MTTPSPERPSLMIEAAHPAPVEPMRKALSDEIAYMREYASGEARDNSIRNQPIKSDYYHGKFKGINEGLDSLLRVEKALSTLPVAGGGEVAGLIEEANDMADSLSHAPPSSAQHEVADMITRLVNALEGRL